jgi:hypothetical protein
VWHILLDVVGGKRMNSAKIASKGHDPLSVLQKLRERLRTSLMLLGRTLLSEKLPHEHGAPIAYSVFTTFLYKARICQYTIIVPVRRDRI